MCSIERIIDYTNLSSEPLYVQKHNPAFLNWPDQAHISFNNVSLAYDNKMTNVLRNASVNMKTGDKIGIVGHGNSSFVQSLFRLYEPNTGNIFINGVDIQTINLLELRTKINILTV